MKNVHGEPDVSKKRIVLDMLGKSAVVVVEYMAGSCVWITEHTFEQVLVSQISLLLQQRDMGGTWDTYCNTSNTLGTIERLTGMDHPTR